MLKNRSKHLQRITEALHELNTLKESDRPPKLYIAEGAEAFRIDGSYPTIEELIAMDEISIFETSKGTKNAGQAFKGDKVRILSGETHVEPKPLVVLHDFVFLDVNLGVKA